MIKTKHTKFQFRHTPWTGLASLSMIVGLILIFVTIAEKIWFKEGLAWDVRITVMIYRWRHPWVDSLMYVISQTGASGAGILVIGLSLWFLWYRRWLNAVTLLLGIIGAATLDGVLTFLFERPRPAFISPLAIATSYDFPSGRAIVAVVVYGMVAVFLWRKHQIGWSLVSGIWVTAVAVSQVYRGIHPPSDVLASLSIGALWLFLLFGISDSFAGHR